jgi:mono/diheme cytochrome c family protein
MDGIARRSMFFFMVISIVVLILAFVSAQGPTATAEVAGLYTTRCSFWHGPDYAGKTPLGQRLNLRDLAAPEVWKVSDSDLSHSITHVNGKMPAFGKNLSEDQTQLLVAHIHESARSSRLEKWSWQPVTRG